MWTRAGHFCYPYIFQVIARRKYQITLKSRQISLLLMIFLKSTLNNTLKLFIYDVYEPKVCHLVNKRAYIYYSTQSLRQTTAADYNPGHRDKWTSEWLSWLHHSERDEIALMASHVTMIRIWHLTRELLICWTAKWPSSTYSLTTGCRTTRGNGCGRCREGLVYEASR